MKVPVCGLIPTMEWAGVVGEIEQLRDIRSMTDFLAGRSRPKMTARIYR
ncbi:hypothetical protein [Sphingomonas sp. S2M10]|nr:hypothetical protein [Sphingomonas sp. S2M10]